MHLNLHVWWANLTGWLFYSYQFLRLHVFTSTRFSRSIIQIVWLLVHQCGQFALALNAVSQTICLRVLSLGSHIICLALLVALVSCVKSLGPRYKFLASEKEKSASRKRELLGRLLTRQSCSLCEKSVIITRDYEEATQGVKFSAKLAGLFERLLDAGKRMSGACSSSVTNGNIQSIYKGLAWSSTRSEFESVYWFNHTIQTLWPSLRTSINKALVEAKKSNAASNEGKKEPATSSAVSMARRSTLKAMMIKERDIQRKHPKLAVYLSCRRQLELLRKNKELVMRKGDEYLGQKVIMMLIYLLKKFILCAKQCFVEQLAWLVEFASSFGSPPLGMNGENNNNNNNNNTGQQAKSRVIELDLREILRKQNVRFRAPSSRQTKTAPERSGPAKSHRAPRIRFKSAPAPGLACNSRRIINASSGLISFDGLKSLHAKRQRLARSINQMLVALDCNRKRQGKKMDQNVKNGTPKRPPLIVDRLEIGNSAPKITSIKFVEKEDRHLMAEILRKNCPLPASNSNNMRLIIEFTYTSDSKFNIKLSSVPLLGLVRLTKFELRLRLLVSINHKDFDDHRNLSIIEGIGGNHLLPILNHVQVSLVDMPQLDWHIEQDNYRPVAASTRNDPRGRQRRREARSSALGKRTLSDRLKAPIRAIKRGLQPARLINHAYFKYLIHAAIFCLQKWFQSFDIRVGELVYLKTLW